MKGSRRLLSVLIVCLGWIDQPSSGFVTPSSGVSHRGILHSAGMSSPCPPCIQPHLGDSTSAQHVQTPPFTAQHHFKGTKTCLPMSTKAAETRASGRKRLSAVMAFIAGYADILFFANFKTFATMLTGSTLWMALAIVERRQRDFAYYGCIMLSYLMGTAAFRRIDLSLRKKTLPVCAALVSILFCAGDWLQFTAISWTHAQLLPMMLFASGYGIINAVGSEVSGVLTFVVTGHLTKLVNQLVDRISRRAGRIPLKSNAVLQNSAVVGGFIAGALFGGLILPFASNKFGAFALIGIIHAALWLGHDIEALGGAWWLRKNQAMCDLDDDGVLCDDDVDDEKTKSLGSVPTQASSSATITNSTGMTRSSDKDDPDALRP